MRTEADSTHDDSNRAPWQRGVTSGVGARPVPGDHAARRILVVDDEDLILEVAQMSLELVGGWSVTTARSGQEAIVKAGVELPDAIVMDVMMPGMDGPTASRALSEDPLTADIPIVLLTAKVQESDRRAFEELPVVGVLAKPFDPMLLPGELAVLLGWL